MVERRFFKFVRTVVYKSSSVAFFGETFDWKNTIDDFFVFDANFVPVTFSGLPEFLFPNEIIARNKVLEAIRKIYVEDSSSIFKNFKKYYFSEFTSNFAIGVLVGSQANSVNGSFWVFSNILKDSKLKERIQKEIEENFDENNIGESFKKMDLLDSCIKETLRMNAFSVVFREITSNFTMEMDGQTYLLKKGEEILASTTNSNKNYYENPEQFIGDRFLDKNGKCTLDATFNPFGGGSHICPGRFFAKHELMVIVILLLKYCDCSLDEFPVVNSSKVNFFPPINKVNLNIKLKK
jgi:hypothetical protein